MALKRDASTLMGGSDGLLGRGTRYGGRRRGSVATSREPPAGRTEAVGGRVFLTNKRVIFMANRFDHAAGGDDWSRPLTDIVVVSIEPRSFGIPLVTPDVDLRRRLRMECRDGTVELFVVNHVEDAADRVRAAISSAG